MKRLIRSLYARLTGLLCARPTGLLGMLIALFLTFCLLTQASPALAASNAGENGQISGQLLDGTNANAPLPGQSVTLQKAQGSNSKDLTTVTTDAQGSFSFSNLSTDKTINYAVFVLYQGAQYLHKDITLDNNPSQQVNLTVYEATQNTDKLKIAIATVSLQEPDIDRKTINVTEDFVIENSDSSHTYVGVLKDAQEDKPNALLFSLPAGATNPIQINGFAGYEAKRFSQGFATNAALPPGFQDFTFSFDLPYTSSTYDFNYETFLPTASLSFFVPPDIHASSQVLTSQGIVNSTGDNQHPSNLLKAAALPSQKNVDLHLEGLLTQVPSDSPTSFNPLLIWLIVAGIIILAALGILWFVINARQPIKGQQARSKKSSARRSQKKGVAVADKVNKSSGSTASEREQALLDALLKLDQAYEEGKLSKEVYQERRTKTKARLRSILSEKESSVH